MPSFHAAPVRRRRLWLLTAIAALAAILPGAVLLYARVNHKPGYNSFSPDQDIELGREAAKDAEKELTLVNDAQLNDYVNRLGQRLAGYAPGNRFPYTFKLVNSKELNAFALPGGPVYIHTAIISAAANEAQLAGVMAHEISHVALRHSTNQASKAMLAQAPLAILGGVFSGGLGQLAQLGIGFGLQSTFLKFSRSAEKQADEQGAQILYDAGYDPKSMADFFAVLERETGRGGSEFFASHPNPGNRQKDVAQLIPSLGPARQFVTDSPEFAAMKARVSGIAAAPDRRPATANQPSTQSGTGRPPLPSQRLKTLNTEWFGIQYPDNWQVYGENTSTVTLVPPQGVVAVGQSSALAYGALISIFEATPEAGRRLTLDAATGQLVRDLQRSNADLRVVGRPRTFKGPGGAEMMAVNASGRSPLQGQNESNLIITTFRPEGLWYMVFIAPEADYRNWDPSFQQMLNSLRFPR